MSTDPFALSEAATGAQNGPQAYLPLPCDGPGMGGSLRGPGSSRRHPSLPEGSSCGVSNPAPAWRWTLCGWHPSGDHLLHCPSSHPLNLPAAGLFSRTRCHLHHLSSTREGFRPPRTRVHRQTGFMKARWVRDPAPQTTSRPGSGGAGETWPCGCPMEVEHQGWSITRQIDDAYCFLGHPVPVTLPSLHPGPPLRETASAEC